jgi:tetratricopeptide (TPR) repeat protein
VGGFRLDSRIGAGESGTRAGVDASLFQEAPSSADYIQALQQRVAENPDSQELWTELGNAHFDSDQYLKAIDAYKRSLELDPGNANVWTDMGIMYRRIGEYSKAVEAFDRAVEENPDHQMSRFNKGIVQYYDLKDRVGAFRSWDELAKMNPEFRTPDGRTIVRMIGELR